eukprot:358024-Chlamydomonas_euryale.AAC.3
MPPSPHSSLRSAHRTGSTWRRSWRRSTACHAISMASTSCACASGTCRATAATTARRCFSARTARPRWRRWRRAAPTTRARCAACRWRTTACWARWCRRWVWGVWGGAASVGCVGRGRCVWGVWGGAAGERFRVSRDACRSSGPGRMICLAEEKGVKRCKLVGKEVRLRGRWKESAALWVRAYMEWEWKGAAFAR